MKNNCLLILLLSCVLVLAGNQVFAKNNHNIQPDQSNPVSLKPVPIPFPPGEIRGIVESCFPDTVISGVLVHIPGLSIMAKTDAEGSFRLLNVPRGTYEIMIEVSGEEPFFISDVKVSHLSVTNLGIISICNECDNNNDCPPDSFCLKSEGECGGKGKCKERPFFCVTGPNGYEPVCGCDGNTYDNDCLASSHGVSIAYEGECDPTPISCTDNDACESMFKYCSKDEGNCVGEGTCTIKPSPMSCPLNVNPVCGCDGKTYRNDCIADSSGVNVIHIGDCIVACTEDADCDTDSYCARDIGMCGGEGTCKMKPNICMIPIPPNESSVCGCDGNTYISECSAASQSMNIAHEGECQN